MVKVPAATPVTMPVELMVAFVLSLLLQTPPEVVLDKVVVDPTHILRFPVIAVTVGNGFTLTKVPELVPVVTQLVVTATFTV